MIIQIDLNRISFLINGSDSFNLSYIIYIGLSSLHDRPRHKHRAKIVYANDQLSKVVPKNQMQSGTYTTATTSSKLVV